jgi:low temperature requirement protein LtrA
MPAALGADAAGAPERRTSPVELLWDLVFVFAVTQVTTLLAHRTSWERLGQGMLVLALVWWAWSAFVWAANAHPADSRTLRSCLLAGTVLIFVVGLALPNAFGRNSLLFAATYAAVRLLHLAVYVDASRRGSAGRAAITGFAVTVLIGMALLLAGALADGWARALLWTLAVAIDYAGPAWLTRERLRGLQQVAVDHFAERYGAFVIICLGESIAAVGVGVGTAGRHLTPGLNSVSGAMPEPGRLAMCGGAALYIAGVAAFRLRMLGDRSLGRPLAALALLVLYTVSGRFPAWTVGALIAAVLGVLCAAEAVTDRAGAAGAVAREGPAPAASSPEPIP